MKFAAKCQFAQVDAAGKTAPITIFARSAEPVEHWFWGRCVHDMSGMSLRKEKCPLDYEHSSYEVIGFADQFTANDSGLSVSGKLVSHREDDRAAEVMFKGGEGVPYEASIDFDPGKLLIEEIDEGYTAFVNGQQMEGPLTIFREWELRGVAIARFGQDASTVTSFSDQPTQEVEVTITETEPMADSTKPEAPEVKDQPVAEGGTGSASAKGNTGTASATPDEATAFSKAQEHVKAELGKFTATFGSELGVTYFSEGKKFPEACTLFIQHQATEIAKRDEQITKFREQLAAIDTGEKNPATFSTDEPTDEGKGEPVPTQFAQLPIGLGKFAAGISLPSRKAAAK